MRSLCVFLIASALAFGQSFEVASIRPRAGNAIRSGPLTISSPLIRLEGYTVFGLVMDSYDLKPYQLSFGSVAPREDIYGTMYDIVARAPGDRVPSLDAVRAMLRQLLAGRFQFQAHMAPKLTDVYYLEISKRVPKLKPTSTAGACSIHTSLAEDGRNDENTFSSCSTIEIAGRLSDLLGRSVLDRTALNGQYDVRLIAIPEFRTHEKTSSVDVSPFSAIADLGFKLIPAKASIPILIVDRLARPTGN